MTAEERGDQTLDADIIFGYQKKCQTKDAKYLLIEQLYEKLHRPNMYNIGGTYHKDARHFSMMCQTEHTSKLFLFHIFVCNCDETLFTLSMSSSSQLTVDKKNNSVYFSNFLKEIKFSKTKPMDYSYVTTYSFTDIDLGVMKNRKAYLPIKIILTENYNPKLDKDLSNLRASHDFGSLLTDPFGSDFIIESIEGEKFHVHKLILAAHSKVFETMFKEENKLLYNIEDSMTMDVETDELRCFLEFIYTGSIKDIHIYNVIALLHLADKYDVKGLQDLCEHVLCKLLCHDNALNVLVWSDLYNSEVLKAAAMKFIKMHPSILESNVFKEIRNVDLVQDILRYMIMS